LLTAEKIETPNLVVLTAVDEPGWQDWLAQLGPEFKDILLQDKDPKLDEARLLQNRQTLEHNGWAFAIVAPRGIGPTRWATTGTPVDVHIRRRFPLLGQTLDGQRVWDVRRAVQVVHNLPDLQRVPLWLQGKGEAAGIALYAALFEPDVARLDLWHPPASHRQGPIFLNVLRTLDLPQAVALSFPRQIRLYVKDEAEARAWDWPLQLQRSLGETFVTIRPVGD